MAAKAAVKTNVEIQYDGKSVTYDEILTKAKSFWTGELGKKASELKTLDLYVKPEEGRVYYVANGVDSGSFEL
ncbi:DUF6465 family protein [Butyrivibrio sp. MC2013]|uniref:DUF6465 family protein n=1 Tax=Butyrivibrio sp. MC2013 TaxID=1280686 RepID=UPI0003F97CAA|nr:DUF6465 family protein [Butyrivibrio sp. MC2013]